MNVTSYLCGQGKLNVYTFAIRPEDGKKIRHYICPEEIAKAGADKMEHTCSDHTATVATTIILIFLMLSQYAMLTIVMTLQERMKIKIKKLYIENTLRTNK